MKISECTVTVLKGKNASIARYIMEGAPVHDIIEFEEDLDLFTEDGIRNAVTRKLDLDDVDKAKIAFIFMNLD